MTLTGVCRSLSLTYRVLQAKLATPGFSGLRLGQRPPPPTTPAVCFRCAHPYNPSRVNAPCFLYTSIVYFSCTRDMGGLPPNSTGHTAGILVWEAAMSLYEILDLALSVIQLGIDIIQRLLRRRKKGKRVKK